MRQQCLAVEQKFHGAKYEQFEPIAGVYGNTTAGIALQCCMFIPYAVNMLAKLIPMPPSRFVRCYILAARSWQVSIGPELTSGQILDSDRSDQEAATLDKSASLSTYSLNRKSKKNIRESFTVDYTLDCRNATKETHI